MLSGVTRKSNMRSTSYWFTESCNSQCLSHFAAPFIVVRAETSITGSCDFIVRFAFKYIGQNADATITNEDHFSGGKETCSAAAYKPPTTLDNTNNDRALHALSHHYVHRQWLESVNDPSAGSPTETLLRLLLPLSDEVH